MAPLSFYTSPGVQLFFSQNIGKDMNLIANMFKSHFLSGSKGEFPASKPLFIHCMSLMILVLFLAIVLNHHQQVAKLKGETAALILENLRKYLIHLYLSDRR